MRRLRLVIPFFAAALLLMWGRRHLHRKRGQKHKRFRLEIERGVMIPMEDGVQLCADHYHPITAEKCPTILIRTPYGRNRGAGVFGWFTGFCGQYFAEHGYEVLVQDTRGRFDSEGEFEPFFREGQDGKATFNWLKQQPWFDGQVGMWGSSYLGIVQWAAADDPAVKALVPGITASSLYDVIFPDGALDLGLLMRWMSLLRILEKRRHSMRQLGILLEIEYDIRSSFDHLPVIEADYAMRSGAVDYFHEWVEAALYDPAFAEQLRCVDPAAVKAPVHLIGGWHDFFLRGLLDDYAALKAAGQTPYLTIGPWSHFSNLFLMSTMLTPGVAWFDAHLKGQPQHLQPAPVRLYVMGAKEWRDYPDYPPPSSPRHYYLQGEGKLEVQPANSAPSHFCYDPTHPTPIIGGAQFHLLAGARNNRKLERRADVLMFTSDVLDSPVEMIGSTQLELYVRSSSEYTDFFGRLCDVSPNGRSINICDGLFRLEPGKGECQPDGSIRISIGLSATAYRFLAGHRIRLLVSSGSHPHWARHTNTAHPLTDTVTRPAEQTIYHDMSHPSALILPEVS